MNCWNINNFVSEYLSLFVFLFTLLIFSFYFCCISEIFSRYFTSLNLLIVYLHWSELLLDVDTLFACFIITFLVALLSNLLPITYRECRTEVLIIPSVCFVPIPVFFSSQPFSREFRFYDDHHSSFIVALLSLLSHTRLELIISANAFFCKNMSWLKHHLSAMTLFPNPHYYGIQWGSDGLQK